MATRAVCQDERDVQRMQQIKTRKEFLQGMLGKIESPEGGVGIAGPEAS
jgi:hypothetical protein